MSILQNIQNITTKINNDIESTRSPSIFTTLPFSTYYGKIASQSTLDKYSNLVDREESFTQLNKLIKDINISIEIESSIFEFSYDYLISYDVLDSLFNSIYQDKLRELLLNLDTQSHLQNKDLLVRIKNKTLNANYLSFYEAHEINKTRWGEQIRKRDMIEYKKNNVVYTDLFKCKKCNARKCTFSQMQTRSSDEPMSSIITCQNCGVSFKQN
jgi:DNA-directed RNA polymerase subunit M/transcription elongation factor TFIIS